MTSVHQTASGLPISEAGEEPRGAPRCTPTQKEVGNAGGRRMREDAGGCGRMREDAGGRRMREDAGGCGRMWEARSPSPINAKRRAARVGQPAGTQTLLQNEALVAYIMPPIPPMPPSAAPVPQLQPFFSGRSAMRHSVVSMRPAIEAAFCRAERVTFVGSTTPLVSRSS